MKFFSIRWKLSLALIGLSLTLVGSYVFLAKRTFESDKISYVFDTNQSQLRAVQKNFDFQLTQAFFTARAISATLDQTTKSLTPIGKNLFQAQSSIKSLRISDPASQQVILLYPENAVFPSLAAGTTPPAAGDSKTITIQALPNHLFLLVSREKNSDGAVVQMEVTVFLRMSFPDNSSAVFFLADKKKIVDQNTPFEQTPEMTELLQEMFEEQNERTFIRSIDHTDYLVSSTLPSLGDFRLISLTDKKSALGALEVLYKRSLIFILFSTFVTILISLALSGGLTQSLAIITGMAVKLSKGNFTGFVPMKSKDEIGILSQAFVKMSSEIERLINETRDKVRMEEELKTASLIQESLLPAMASTHVNRVEIAGSLKNSTECGGDWWYYFQRGDDLYVAIADATGHGTPAALITAAARSTFAIVADTQMSLEEMMTAWDHVVYSCSANRVFMTALLLRLNTKTGHAAVISASHEWPFIFRTDADGKLQEEALKLNLGATLGERKLKEWNRNEFLLQPGERLLLYTDGLFSVKNAEGQDMSERRFIRALQKITTQNIDAPSFLKACENVAQDFYKKEPIPDDITLVSIHFL